MIFHIALNDCIIVEKDILRFDFKPLIIIVFCTQFSLEL